MIWKPTCCSLQDLHLALTRPPRAHFTRCPLCTSATRVVVSYERPAQSVISRRRRHAKKVAEAGACTIPTPQVSAVFRATIHQIAFHRHTT